MNEYGSAVIETGTVRFERVLPGPIERVWAYLTDSDKRAKWLASGPMEPRVGGRVHLTWHNSQLSADQHPPAEYKKHDGHSMEGRVTRCEPPRAISFTWPLKAGGESEVSFELTTKGDDVLLVLTHRRMADRAGLLSVSGGWHAHLGILEDQLSGAEPRPFWATHAKLAAEYAQRLGN